MCKLVFGTDKKSEKCIEQAIKCGYKLFDVSDVYKNKEFTIKEYFLKNADKLKNNDIKIIYKVNNYNKSDLDNLKEIIKCVIPHSYSEDLYKKVKEWCVNNDIDFGLPEYKKTEKECYVYEMSVEQYLRCYEEFVKESICYVYNVYHYFEIIKKLNKSLSDENALKKFINSLNQYYNKNVTVVPILSSNNIDRIQKNYNIMNDVNNTTCMNYEDINVIVKKAKKPDGKVFERIMECTMTEEDKNVYYLFTSSTNEIHVATIEDMINWLKIGDDNNCWCAFVNNAINKYYDDISNGN